MLVLGSLLFASLAIHLTAAQEDAIEGTEAPKFNEDYCDSTLCLKGQKHVACNASLVLHEACSLDAEVLVINDKLQRFLVGRFNALRDSVAKGGFNGLSPAARMGTLKWDPELSYLAEFNVQDCYMKSDECRNTKTSTHAGQIVGYRAMRGKIPDLEDILKDIYGLWMRENSGTSMLDIIKYKDPKKGPPKYNFIQIVLENAGLVGCAVLQQTRNDWLQTFFTCNFGQAPAVGSAVYETGQHAATSCKTGVNPKYVHLCSESEEYEKIGPNTASPAPAAGGDATAAGAETPAPPAASGEETTFEGIMEPTPTPPDKDMLQKKFARFLQLMKRAELHHGRRKIMVITSNHMLSVASSTSAAATAAASVASGSASSSANVQEFKIRVPKMSKKHHVMRFNATLNVDFAQWRNVKLERENNMKEFRGMEEDQPKFARKYRPEAQPWILKVGGKTGKKFKGIREGGVGENAAFYVFTHAPDGAIEAYPLTEWYNFQPIQRYKSLSAEEAEQEFGRRKKITDMDEWIDSEDESDSEDEEDKKKKEQEDSDDGKAKGKGKKGADKKKKKRDVDDEAFEESDDGDEEGREMDYDTSSSEDEPDPEAKVDKDMKGVAEEDALRKLLTSDEEEEDEKKSDESDKEDADGEKKKKEKGKEEGSKDKKKKKPSKDDKKGKSTGSGDSRRRRTKRALPAARTSTSSSSNANKSRSATPTLATDVSKRKMNSLPSDLTGSDTSNSPTSTPAKRPKNEITTSLPTSFSGGKVEDYGITEEAVRRYLKRKPLTATELLTKFKNKKTPVSSDRLVETMTKILKKINPVKHTIQGKMYLWIK
ncbi:hypothetical protein M5D96_000378 [Drosophila gunungcola]|uniref:General transcription factor IIF subunit 1 n=1 Tax=Drosophila gunungcola TaxID=103775 RepID=A0A9Q0BTP3_9MUSC|nr:hypothetical protein M5D96_000378 [Drosophila gunungcola]